MPLTRYFAGFMSKLKLAANTSRSKLKILNQKVKLIKEFSEDFLVRLSYMETLFDLSLPWISESKGKMLHHCKISCVSSGTIFNHNNCDEQLCVSSTVQAFN